MKIRYIKVLRDVTSDYAKNLMLVAAIALGIIGIGSILGGYAVVKREMTSNYLGTRPASATIEVDGDLDRALVDSVTHLPGILVADRRATLMARMKIGDRWYPLLLFVMDDFRNQRISTVKSVSGAIEPATGTMLAERSALSMMAAKEGEFITIKTANGDPKSIRLAGTVHDPGLAPARQEQAGYGYITLATLHWLGETQGFDQLKFRVAEYENSAPHITKKAGEVAAWLEKKGTRIHDIQIPPPNRHPHQSQMNTVMSLFIVFSFLVLILGSILVATSMATLMVKQIRQIGVMKTIGARSMQIAGLYLLMMSLLCVAALVVGLPLSRFGASLLYNQLAGLLNLELTDRSIPYWVPLLQMSSGLVIPLMAVAFPVIRGSRLSVRKAIDNYGVSQRHQRSSDWGVWLRPLTIGNETFRLSLRNAFRQRTRLVMTLGLLAAGGAMFMTALNVSEAWNSNLRRIYTQRLYDLEVKLNAPFQVDTLIPAIKHLSGIRIVEGWDYAPTSFSTVERYEIAHTYPDKGHGSFSIQALPVPTQLLNPTLVKGQWLTRPAANDVVLNQLARAYSTGINIGDSISLAIDGKATRWHVIGFTEDVGSPATAYVSIEAFRNYTKLPGRANMLRIAFSNRASDYVTGKTREVERLLERSTSTVRSTTPVWLLHNAVAAHMRVLVNSLLAMAILMAIVGTLGLMSTMSMNVLERTREIGIMRAIGATPKIIRNLVVWEGLVIGAFSVLIAFLFSLLLSTYMGRLIGNLAFRTPLSLTISALALSIWVCIIVIGSYIASVFPAQRAIRITTCEALAYE